jgi:uncharacterized protein
MQCPTCSVPLTMSERQGVEIDYCPKCRGVWLDRGELDKIISRNATETAPVGNGEWRQPTPANQAQQAPHHQAAPQQQDLRGQGAPPQKRRRSFLEDLFD